MHPGNIFVLVDDPAQPRYAAVDFGIVGTLDLRDQRYLAENFLAVFDRDYRRVATLHVQSGWVPADTRVDEMESAVRTICEPIFDRPLKEISFGTVLLRLFEALRRFDGQIQPQLLLLQKTLLNVEGLGTPALSRARHLADRQPGAAPLDARAREPAQRAARTAARLARRAGDHQGAAAAGQARWSSRRRTARCACRWTRARSTQLRAQLTAQQPAQRPHRHRRCADAGRRAVVRPARSARTGSASSRGSRAWQSGSQYGCRGSASRCFPAAAPPDRLGARAQLAVLVEQRRADLVLAAADGDAPADHDAGLLDVHAAIDVRGELAQHHRRHVVARRKCTGTVEGGADEHRPHLALAVRQRFVGAPGRGHQISRAPTAGEYAQAVAARALGAADEAALETGAGQSRKNGARPPALRHSSAVRARRA